MGTKQRCCSYIPILLILFYYHYKLQLQLLQLQMLHMHSYASGNRSPGMGSSAIMALVFCWWLTDSFNNFLSLAVSCFFFSPAIEFIVWDTLLESWHGWASGSLTFFAFRFFCSSFLLLFVSSAPLCFCFYFYFFAVLILFLHGSSIWVLYGVYGVCGMLSPRPWLDLWARFHGCKDLAAGTMSQTSPCWVSDFWVFDFDFGIVLLQRKKVRVGTTF